MTSNRVQRFNFNSNEVRVLADNQGEPWFVAKDVCDILGLTNTSVALSQLDEDEVHKVDPKNYLGSENHSNQAVNIVSEAGLYKLIMRSRKDNAKPFQRWVTHEVLPTIRKHGAYMSEQTIEQVLTSPDFLIKLATQLKSEKEARKQAEAQLEQAKPKLLFADAVETSNKSILVGVLATILRANGVQIGQKRLFQALRENGFLCSTGSRYNLPTQKSVELGLFEVKETTVVHADGHKTINLTPKVTGKGQVYFVNYFLKKPIQEGE